MASEPPAEPPKPATDSAPQPANEPVVHITFPPWLTNDWALPSRAAFLTIAIGIGFQYLVGLLLVIGALIDAPSNVPWSILSRFPPGIWLGFNLGAQQTVIILTGFVWIRLSVRVAAKRLRHDADPARNKILERAVRFAVAYAVLELAIALTLQQFDRSSFRSIGTPFVSGFRVGVDPASAFFFGLLIGFVAGVYFFARSAGVRLRDLWAVRIDTQVPAVIGIVLRGLGTALKIAIPGMMVFTYLAAIIPIQGQGIVRESISLIPTLLAIMIFWSGVDTGLTGLLVAMQLFLGQHLGGLSVPFVSPHNPAWIYSGIAIPLIALFVGGMRIAREDRTQTPSQAATRGAFVGIPLSFVCLIYGALHSTAFSGGFLGRAFLVSFLWGGASAAGAFFEASQHPPVQSATRATP